MPERIQSNRPNRALRRINRLTVRVSPAQKALAQQAAALQGRTLSEFVAASVQHAAEQAIREHKVVALTAEDSRAFAEALLAPPAPNEHLRTLAEQYRRITVSD